MLTVPPNLSCAFYIIVILQFIANNYPGSKPSCNLPVIEKQCIFL